MTRGAPCPIHLPPEGIGKRPTCGRSATVEIGLPLRGGEIMWIGPWCRNHAESILTVGSIRLREAR